MLRFGLQILGHASIDLLRRIDAPLDDVVPAKRAITLRDLLTCRFALGAVMIWPPAYPIQKAMEAAGLMPGPNPVELTPDDFMKRLGTLPLIDQPGEKNPMGNPNRTIRRKEITELARQTWLRIWSDQMPKDWRVYLVRKTVNSAGPRAIGLRRPLARRQENSGGSPHQTLQLPNARTRTRASSNAR